MKIFNLLFLRSRLPVSFFAVTMVLLTGCTSSLRVPTENILMVDRTGEPLDPTGNISCKNKTFPCEGEHSELRSYPKIYKESDYDGYVQNILDALDRYSPDTEEGNPPDQTGCGIESYRKTGKKKILIYIHGGLNTQVSTVERAANFSETIRHCGYFPIFINWRSSLVSSYFNQLVYQRQGRDWRGSPYGWGLSPFYLLKDLTRAIARLIPVEVFMFRSDLQNIRTSNEVEKNRQDIMQASNLEIAFGDDKRSGPEKAAYLSAYVATIPTKIVLSPFIDAFGTSSWYSLLRASETPFRTDELDHKKKGFEAEAPSDNRFEAEAPPDNPAVDLRDTNGALNVFLTRLSQYIDQHGKADKFEVVLIGHSMGTILLNHILREQISLPVTNIVYMAAACSIKDYEDTVFPYLRLHKNVNVYHLALHRRADLRDRTTAFGLGVLDLPPRGSLLVWIDNFLSDPQTYRDRTTGRMVNLLAALGDLDKWTDIKPQIHVREFSVGNKVEGTDPQHHGDFGSITFWDPECWKPHPKTPEECYKLGR